MSKVVLLKQAAAETGISYSELYSGVRSGKYPGYQVGTSKHGKWVTDLDILKKRIEELMQQNMQRQDDDSPVIQYGVLRRAKV